MGYCRPKARIYLSRINQRMDWWKALAELIDNALDAGATVIQLEVHPDVLIVWDNGKGIANEACLLTLGEHVEGDNTTLGTYGIGAKDAWASCADVLHLDTVCDGQRLEGMFDLNHIQEHDFHYDDPTASQVDHESYTRLEFELREGRNPPGRKAFERLRWAFAPALWAGKVVTVQTGKRKAKLAGTQLPGRTDSVSDFFDIDGKPVQIDIGLTDGTAVENGPFWIIFGHRIICGTSIGTGEYSINNIAGTITLGEEWKQSLTPHKDAIAHDTEELEEAVFSRIEPLLKEAQQLSDTFESVQLENDVSDMLNATLGNRKKGQEKRNPPQKSHAARSKPEPTGRTRRNASRVDGDGISKEKRSSTRRGRVFIKFYDDTNTDSIGRFDATSRTIQLNNMNPFVQHHKCTKDRTAIFSCAAAIIADDSIRRPGGTPVLSIVYNSFADAFGSLVSELTPEQEVSHA